MARLSKLLWTSGLSVILASAVLPGCGDDSGDDDATGGKATGGKGGATTGGKGGATTGGKGGATGGTNVGGEAGAPPTVAGGGAGGVPEVVAGAGAGGVPEVVGGGGAGGIPDVVAGAGAGGIPDVVGGAGGSGGGADDVGGAGGTAEGGTGGVEEGGSGGEGGVPEPINACTTSVAWPTAVGSDCADYCDDLFDNCSATLDPDPYADEAACLSACQALAEEALCCRIVHAEQAATQDPVPHCSGASGNDPCD